MYGLLYGKVEESISFVYILGHSYMAQVKTPRQDAPPPDGDIEFRGSDRDATGLE